MGRILVGANETYSFLPESPLKNILIFVAGLSEISLSVDVYVALFILTHVYSI